MYISVTRCLPIAIACEAIVALSIMLVDRPVAEFAATHAIELRRSRHLTGAPEALLQR